MNESPSQIAADITSKIQELETLSGENLKGEMSALKKSLLSNPAACSLLLDEDAGKMVAALRRMTSIALSAATSKKTEKKSDKIPKNLTVQQLQAALDSEDF